MNKFFVVLFLVMLSQSGGCSGQMHPTGGYFSSTTTYVAYQPQGAVPLNRSTYSVGGYTYTSWSTPMGQQVAATSNAGGYYQPVYAQPAPVIYPSSPTYVAGGLATQRTTGSYSFPTYGGHESGYYQSTSASFVIGAGASTSGPYRQRHY